MKNEQATYQLNSTSSMIAQNDLIESGKKEGATLLNRIMAKPFGLIAVIIAIILYSLIFSLKGISNFKTHQMLFDMAVFDQSFWNASHGHSFANTLEVGGNHFAVHFSPIFFLFLPVYMIKSSPTILVIMQSIAIAIAALPLYWLAEIKLKSRLAALLVALCYLFTPAIMDINLINDWHEIAFVIPSLMFAFYFALRVETNGKDKSLLCGYFIAIILTLSVKEDQGFTVIVFGIWLLIRRQWRLGFLTSGFALVYVIVVIGLIIPAYRHNQPYEPVGAFSALGSTLPDIVKHISLQPMALLSQLFKANKISYMEWLVIPVGFLALLSPEILIIALPALFINLITDYAPFFTIFERYTAPLVPTIFVASVIGIVRLRYFCEWIAAKRFGLIKKYSLWLGVSILIVATINAQYMLKRIPTSFSFRPNHHNELAINIISKIPAGASFAAEDHHDLVYATHHPLLNYLSYKSMHYDYLLFDDTGATITNIPSKQIVDITDTVLHKDNYHIVYKEDGLLLLASDRSYRQDQSYWQQFGFQ